MQTMYEIFNPLGTYPKIQEEKTIFVQKSNHHLFLLLLCIMFIANYQIIAIKILNLNALSKIILIHCTKNLGNKSTI